MKLDEIHRQKVDKSLEKALRDANGDEKLRVIVELAAEINSKEASDEQLKLDQSQFSSWQDYRRALIEQMESKNESELEIALAELKHLDLNTSGGKYSRTVLVEGVAQKILDSLELPSVVRASMDKMIEIDEPQRNWLDYLLSRIEGFTAINRD